MEKSLTLGPVTLASAIAHRYAYNHSLPARVLQHSVAPAESVLTKHSTINNKPCISLQ